LRQLVGETGMTRPGTNALAYFDKTSLQEKSIGDIQCLFRRKNCVTREKISVFTQKFNKLFEKVIKYWT
jgi:hypothetical protein